MAKYTQISREQIEELLTSQGFSEVKIEGTREMVFGKIVGPALCLRVYTSIENGHSRESGSDAIRVCLVTRFLDSDGKYQVKGVGRDKRVHRVEGWRANLQARLDNFAELLGPTCPYCGKHMAVRTRRSDKNEFWGCVAYPVCRGTRDVEE
jgi:hypothetical protein